VEASELDDSQLAEWRALAELRGNPFLTPEWYTAYRDGAGAGESFLLAWRPEGILRGVLPLVRMARGPLRVLRFAGDEWADWFTPVCRPEDEGAMAADCASWLTGQAPRWHLLDMARIDAASTWPAALWESGPGRIAAARPRQQDQFPYIRFGEGGFESYLAARSRNFRSQLGRRRRRLEAERGLGFRLTAGAAELDRDFETFVELHHERWSKRGGSGALSPAAVEVHRRFAAAALQRGWLRLWTAEAGGTAAASWYGWRVGKSYCYALSGLREEFEPYALGTVLLAHTIEMAAAEGAETYDLMRGDETYKQRFETGRRQASSWILGRRHHPATLGQAGLDRVSDRARGLSPAVRGPLKRAYRAVAR
jgi:CelD/BcsL family acetyltransferase involved in cellulose biosynthesis